MKKKKAKASKTEAPQEAPQATSRARYGEIRYVCIECGGDLKINHGGHSSPAFLIRNFVCLACGRETDQYVTERKIIRL